jgi:hypothetical protein
LNYIKKYQGIDGIYAILGSMIHDTLENITNGKASESDLMPTLEKELQNLDILGIDFPNAKTRENWIKDMIHFCKTYVKPKGDFTTEEFLLYKVDDINYIQGYADLIKHYKNDPKTISIYDYKTSTNFDGEDLIKAGRQLVIYALAKEQEGYKVKEVAWIMLKYCEVSFMGKTRSNSKNDSLITKIVNRGKLINELKPYLQHDLENMGYDDFDIEMMIDNALKNNSFDNLPDEIKGKYIVKPYVRKYEITDEVIKETLTFIKNMIEKYESKSVNEADWKPRKFTKTTKSGEKDDTFYCISLCSFFKICPHIHKYLELKDLAFSNEEDLF